MRFVVLLLFLPLCDGGNYRKENQEDIIMRLMKVSADLIHDTDERIEQLEHIRVKCRHAAGYEIGYVTKVVQEMYRKQVDKYDVSQKMYEKLYIGELVLYLEEVEHHYWEIEHVSSMVHEIERKYGMREGMSGDYVEFKPEDFTETTKRSFTKGHGSRSRRTKKPKNWNNFWKDAMNRLTSSRPRQTRWWWPLEYGWEIDYYW